MLYTKTIDILRIAFNNKNLWLTQLKEINKATSIKLNIVKSLVHTTWEENVTSFK